MYALFVASVWALLIVAVALPRRNGNADLQPIMWMLYTFLTLFIPKVIYALFSLIGKLPTLWKGKKRSFGVWIGMPLAVVVCASLWWGALVTRRSVEVIRTDVESANLPTAFDGYKIVQISDLHVGTWGNDTSFVSMVVDSVNILKPDLILFTGDIVNRHTSELLPFVDILSRLKSEDGVYSVLGNHDYGDYMDWNSAEQRKMNNKQLINIQSKMGWQLLNNSHVNIYANGDSIILIGVENWGEPPFKVYGDLSKAYTDLKDDNFKILMSHNPEHWHREVTDISNIDLTLSGHTHAMQMILRVGGWKWSPSKWKYEQWGGLYHQTASDGTEMQIYVNIGLGEVALPFRLGATPEISLITLRKSAVQ